MWSIAELLERKKRSVVELRQRDFEPWLRSGRPKRRRLSESLLRNYPCAIIAEVKLASPSSGRIFNGDPISLAKEYVSGGAAGISVVTDPFYFGGDIDLLKRISELSPVPVLRKDFVLDVVQLLETKAMGADAVLLISSICSEEKLEELIKKSYELDLEPLVEVHSSGELKMALRAGAKLIGINNRDLSSLKVDISTTELLADDLPDDVIVVSESGIKNGADINRLNRAGVYSFLIGTALITAERVHQKIRNLFCPLKKLIVEKGPFVKFCGITNNEDAKKAIDSGCDMLGFVLCEGKRKLDDISSVLKDIPLEIPKIGVFTVKELKDWLLYVKEGIECFQIHRNNPAEMERVLSMNRCLLIPSFNTHKIDESEIRANAVRFPVIHMDSADIGGSGKALNWEVAEGVIGACEDTRFVVAGGLTPQNVRGIVEGIRPWAVDVSSGIESALGKKDSSLMRLFIEQVKACKEEAYHETA